MQPNNHKQTATQTELTHNSQQRTNSECEQLTKVNIASLFKGWKKLFRSKMKDEDWEIDTITVWHIALNDLQITPHEFMLAKRKSLSLQWPPTAPADFLALARLNSLANYPDMRQAYLDAANQRTDCPIAYETARRVGFSQMRHGYEYITYPIWQKHYAEVCTEHSRGIEFKNPQVLQIEDSNAPAAIDELTSDEWIANIRAILAGDKK